MSLLFLKIFNPLLNGALTSEERGFSYYHFVCIDSLHNCLSFSCECFSAKSVRYYFEFFFIKGIPRKLIELCNAIARPILMYKNDYFTVRNSRLLALEYKPFIFQKMIIKQIRIKLPRSWNYIAIAYFQL